MTINIIIVGFCSLSQAIAFYVTFRLRARGRLDDLFIFLPKKSRKSFPFKTGWESNESAIVLHQQINKQWNNQPGIYSGFQIEQTLSITKSLLKRWTNREVVISVCELFNIFWCFRVENWYDNSVLINSIFIDKIDNPNSNIDNYRLLTPNFFIEFRKN